MNPVHTIDLSFFFISNADGGDSFSHQNLSVPSNVSTFSLYHLNGMSSNVVAYSNAMTSVDLSVLFYCILFLLYLYCYRYTILFQFCFNFVPVKIHM
uniref:Uncharacterized protein n=1 Tax=viral metagenome TaxID=1070528 RepID=A0A6C0H324_9ZZZZ